MARTRRIALAVLAAALIVLVAVWQRSSDAAWLVVFGVVCVGVAGMFVLSNTSGGARAHDDLPPDDDQS